MQPTNILEIIENEISLLVPQKLRGKATMIYRVYHHIIKAQELGYTHEAIHAATKKGGLDFDLQNYHIAVHRVKKSIESGRAKLTKELLYAITNQPTNTQAPSTILDAINNQHIAENQPSNETVTTTTASKITDTLKTSVTAGRKDYSKAALQSLKDKGKIK